MRGVLRIFFKTEGTKPGLVLACLVLAGFAEGLGVSSLLPAISAIAGGESASAFSRALTDAFRRIGIEPTPGNLILIMASLMVLKSILAFTALSYAATSVAHVATSLRRKLFEALFEARWSYFSSQHVGRFANAMSNEATRAAAAYNLAALFVSYSLQALTYALVGLLIDWKLALAGLALGLAIAGGTGSLVRLARRAGLKQTNRTGDITIFVTDVMSNLKPLKTMERHGPMRGLMEAILAKLRRALITQELAKQGLLQATDALTAVVLGAGVYVAAMVWKVPLAELIVMGIVFFQAFSLVTRMQKYLQGSVLLQGAYDSVQELIAEARSEAERHSGRKPPALDRSVEFEAVSFAHEETAVVTEASFSIPVGSITVLQGPSGAGKTTLIDLLAGLHAPDSGRITVDGVPLSELDMQAWRGMLGYVPQELQLLHGTVRENIALGDPAIDDRAILEALEQAGAAGFVAALPGGLDADVGEMGGKLSGGQRQRISLARALVSGPRLLILDEVTSALDPQAEIEICRNIAALAGAYTIIAITHRPAWTRIATRLYRVDKGKVEEAVLSE